MKQVTINNLTLDVDPTRLDDIETLEALAEFEETEKPLAIITAMRKVFGDRNYGLIKQHLKDENGRTSVTAVAEFFQKYVEELAPKA